MFLILRIHMYSKSFVWLFAFVAVLFTIGFAPNLTQDAFADVPAITAFTANDPDDLDTVYSNDDTFTLTFSLPINVTASATMSQGAIDGNFTLSGGADFGTTYAGLWSGDRQTLVISVTDISAATDPIITTTTIVGCTVPAAGCIGHAAVEDNPTGPTISPALGGDYGLFVAVTTGGGSGCNGDCTEPTLGVLSDGRRIVDNGFSYNGKSVDVEYYFTPYPLVTVQVGKQNVAEFKIYENLGIDNIRHFELAFGLANGESIGMSKAVINWDKTFDGIETVTIVDPENVLDKVKVTTSEGYCSDEMQTKCLIVKVVHTFRAPLDFNILGTNVWDAKRNAWQNYYNHGIEVVGESLNPPKEYDVSEKRQFYHLTEIGKDTAFDEFGNSWSLEYGLWTKDYVKPQRIVDSDTNVFTRMHSEFAKYKDSQAIDAIEKLLVSCPTCLSPYDGFVDSTSIDFPDRTNKLNNPEIQKKMLQESIIAENTLRQIFDSLYLNFHF